MYVYNKCNKKGNTYATKMASSVSASRTMVIFDVISNQNYLFGN